jgi:branched-chain amino acid transport system substrate-binding protein
MALILTSPQARRAFIVGATASILALTACQTGPRQPLEPVVPEPPPTGLAYNGIAVIVPLTGPDGPIGTSISNAAKLALVDTKEQTLRITVYNSAAPGGAAAAAAKAIAEGNRLILGPLLAEDVRAAAPVAQRSNVPVIAFSNDEGVAGNGVYILGLTPDQSISRVVAHAQSKGMKSFGALVPTGLYGQRAAQSLLTSVQKSGGRVASVQSYDRNPAAVAAAAKRLNGLTMDAVLVGDASSMAARASTALKAGPRRLGTELWGTDRTIGKNSALRGAWFAAPPDAQFDRLVARYRARYGKTPYRLASLGYDAVLLAVRSSRDWPIGRSFPAKSLIDKDGFGGVDGNFRFGRDGIAERLLEVREVNSAGSTVISPAATAF